MVNTNISELEAKENETIKEIHRRSIVYLVCRKCLKKLGEKSSFRRTREFWEVNPYELQHFKTTDNKVFCACANMIGERCKVNQRKCIRILRKAVRLNY